MGEREEALDHARIVIRQLRSRLAEVMQLRPEPVAIVGMACRFPGGAEDLESFWELTMEGKDAVGDVPHGRWEASAWLGDSAARDPSRPFQASFLNEVDTFDADFFGISTSEAMQMDPAQRLFLEVAWHALEDSGQTKTSLAGSDTAVYVGHTGFGEYLTQRILSGSQIDVYTGTGNGQDVIAGRLSYLLDLHGLSATIQTACSSSLVAVHLARQSLLAGDCRIAVAGGVNILGPVSTAVATRMGFLAPDGRCKAFDERADGFGRGEGCGVVVLKRLSHAQEDHDRILALIHGSAVNQDGATNGLTTPNGRSQVALLRRALSDAQIAPQKVGYLEAHGTGTSLGDPIEVEALVEVFGGRGNDGSPCAVSTAKGNVGHLEGAAGIAGLIRCVLAIQRGTRPPVANFRSLNSHISIQNTRLFFPTQATPWETKEMKYAGVSSFGWSGTNAHVVLGDALTPAARADTSFAPKALILPVSAAHPDSLFRLADATATNLEHLPEVDLPAFVWTAGARRTHHAFRLAAVGNNCSILAVRLREKARSKALLVADSPRIVLFFEAAQPSCFSVIQELMAEEPVFRKATERCAKAIKSLGCGDLFANIYVAEETLHGDLIRERASMFTLQFAVTELLKSWGIRTRIASGRGVGAVTAALATGELGFEQALNTVLRSDHIQETTRTGNLSVKGDPSETFVLQIGMALPHSGRIPASGTTTLCALNSDRPARLSLLETAAALYTVGMEIDWDALSGADRRMVPLPAYPFERKRYWNSGSVGFERVQTEDIAPDNWFYESFWKEVPLTDWPARSDGSGNERPLSTVDGVDDTPTKWLIFADESGVAEQLASAVSNRGGEPILIHRGPSFLQKSDGEFYADAASGEQIEKLFLAAAICEACSVKVVHLRALGLNALNIDTGVEPEHRNTACIAASEDLLVELIQLCRSLAQWAKMSDLKFWAVTRGAQLVGEEDKGLQLTMAPLWGFSTSAALEHPEFWGGIADLDPQASLDDGVELLWREFNAPKSENQVGFRNGRRFVPRLRSVVPPPYTEQQIHADGAYLITGAFGGIGLDIADWLVGRGAKNLVLLSRLGLRPDDAGGDQDSALTGVRSALKRWKERGVNVRIHACDVASFRGMAALFGALHTELPPIRGILHAAAEVIWKPILDLDAEDVRASFRPKVYGSLILHLLSRDLPLDFLAFFSSAAVSIGARNAASYAAANSFMDSLAMERRLIGLRASSIHWGYWKRRSSGLVQVEGQFVRSGFSAMPPRLALNAMGRLLGVSDYRAAGSQPLVAQVDFTQLKAAVETRGQTLFLSELDMENRVNSEAGEPLLVGALRRLPEPRRVELLTDAVSSELRRVLDWSATRPVDITRGLFDLGFDSLKSIQFKNRLENITGLRLSSTLALTHPNVQAVVGFLHTRLFDDDGATPTTIQRATSVEAPPLGELSLDGMTDAETDEALLTELHSIRRRLDD